MQKKIIALAVAGLVSGAAFAQSNVTVYGIADMYYGHVNSTGSQSVNALNSGGLSGSRIGFKGAEDMGNGLKAVFEYELGFNVDSNATSASAINGTTTASASAGNGITNSRQSMVGLAGGFGTAVMGRLQTPGYYNSAKFDALAGSAISPQAILAADQGSTIAPSNAARVNNAAAYISPTFSGFNAIVAYGFGEENAKSATLPDAEKESVFGASLNYDNGPVAASFTYHRVNNVGANNVVNTAFGDLKEWHLGASYNFGIVRLVGSYQRYDTTAANDTDKIWQLGAVAPIGMGNVHFAYGKAARDANSSDSKSWTLAYTHAMSKRTTLYTGYNRTSNDHHANAGLLVAPSAGGKTSGFVGGIRHAF